MIKLILILITLGFILTGCTTISDVNNKDIFIAITGDEELYNYDPSFLNGVKMAIEDTGRIYADQGYNITYEFYDDGTIYQRAMAITNTLANDPKVTAVLGTQSLNILNTAAGIYDANEKLLIAVHGSYSDTMAQGYEYVFKNTFGNEDTAISLAKYAVSNPQINNIAIYRSDTEYEKNAGSEFIRNADGVNIVDYATNVSSDYEFSKLLDRWDLLGVDTVIINEYYEENSFDVLAKIKEHRPDMNILGDFAFDFKELLLEYNEASHGIVISDILPHENTEEYNTFVKRYKQRYGKEPTRWLAHGYDTVKMIVDTAVKVGSANPGDIAKGLRAPEGYVGIRGKLTFDEQGKLYSSAPKLLVYDGEEFVVMQDN